MIDLAALEQALAPIEEVGKQEITFEVEGTVMCLRPLLPLEEVAVQKYTSTIIEGNRDEKGNVDNYAAMDYYDSFCVEVLSHALVQIGELDLRDTVWIQTGQKTSSGKPVRVKKHVALRDKIRNKWSRPMAASAYQKYADLMARIDKASEDLVEFDHSDLGVEIDRVEKRLLELKVELERRAKGDPNLMSKQVQDIAGVNESMRTQSRVPSEAGSRPPAEPEAEVDPEPEPQAEVDPEPEPKPEPEPEPAEPEWADYDEMPSMADLEDKPQVSPREEKPVVSRRVTPRQSVVPDRSPPPGGGTPAPRPRDPLADVPGSFEDPEEEGVIEAETRRIALARRKMAADRVAAEQQQPPAPVRRPPHQRGARPPETDAIEAGEHGGLQAYRMPTQDLSSRNRGGDPSRTAVDVGSDKSKTVNPNFKPPKR